MDMFGCVITTSGVFSFLLDTFGSVINRMNMKLGSNFHSYLRTKTQLLKRLQRMIVVDSTTHSQKDAWSGG